MRLNPSWMEQIERRIAESGVFDVTLGVLEAQKHVILRLTRLNRPFKIYNLGAGVRRITTDTDTCPCCKRKL